MSRRRFFAPPESFDATAAGAEVRLSLDETRHLRDVLRLRAGDEAYVFDGEGREFACVVVSEGGAKGGGAATLEVRERVEPLRPESPLNLSLVVALLKGEKFDTVVQKATELGATRIVPVITARADVRLRDAADAEKRVSRWRRLALEAAKQSGRARLPAVASPVPLASVLEDEAAAESGDGEASFAPDAEEAGLSRETGAGALRLMFAEHGGRGLAETIEQLQGERPRRIAALTGPEGGWEAGEIERAARAGWGIVTLGGRTLRAETAVLAVCALLQHRFGDLV